MKFWNLPMADLGFNLGNFVIFILLIKFAMSEPVWNLLNIIKLKKGIIISNLTVN
ncbi:hypothetical protein [Spiroplasma endosymbiont of Dactylopius coccus]